MPNHKVLQAAAVRRRQAHRVAVHEYRRYQFEVPDLIRQLGGPTSADHDRAFRLLVKMGDAVTEDLLAALSDASLGSSVRCEVISLLSATGDPRAVEPAWTYFQANQHDVGLASSAALALAGLGDERCLPFLRQTLQMGERESVANAAAGMITVGEIADIALLRTVHRQFKADLEIRRAVANAVLTILGEVDRETMERTLNEIENSIADHDLWDDIWAELERTFGPGRHRRRCRY